MPKIPLFTEQKIEPATNQKPTEEVDLPKIADEILKAKGERNWLIKKRAIIPKRGNDFDVVAVCDHNDKIIDIPLIKLKNQAKQLRERNM